MLNILEKILLVKKIKELFPPDTDRGRQLLLVIGFIVLAIGSSITG